MPDPSSWISISSGELRATVNPLGAELSSLRDPAGNDLLWDGNPAIWNGRAPLLFPIVGALAGGSYRLGSKSYRLPRHGFARVSTFTAAQSTPTSASLILKADESTLKVYPFRFELNVQFVVEGANLTVTTTILNAGDEQMPASFGYHPAFRWPLPFGQKRSSHFIEFESEEPAPIRRLNADGLLAPEPHPTPILNRRLALVDSLFQDDAMILDQINSRHITYGALEGPRIRLGFADARYLGIWSKPGANFVCIEPWHGVADLQGFAGDFTRKAGVFMLSPGATVPITMTVSLVGA
jgi:galactose mutarotase-like enzyme